MHLRFNTFLVIAVVLLSSAAAFELNDTTVRSVGLNSEFVVTYPWVFSNLTIASNFIYFGGFNQSTSLQTSQNYSLSFYFYGKNKNYTGQQIPYVSSFGSTTAIVTSNLDDSVNMTVEIEVYKCSLITGARFRSATGIYQSNISSVGCNGNRAVVNVTNVEKGNNLINFNYESNIVNCSLGSDNITLMMTVFDEDNPSQDLVADVDLEVSYWSDPNFVNTYYVGLSGNSTYYLCLNGLETVQADVYAKYTTDNGFTHRYYMINQTLTNVSTNISMYNFNTTTGISDLRLTARRETNYNYYSGVIGMLQRRYPDEGIYRTVQMDESGDYGLIFFNIYEETTDYRIIFKDRSNCILDTTDRMKFACSTGICDLTYLLSACDQSGVANNYQYSWSYNNQTGNITLNWVDLTGITSSTRILVTKETGKGSTTICDTTQSGSSGTLACSVSGYTGEVLLRVFSTASPERPIVSEWVRLTQPSLGVLLPSAEGAFWSVGIMVTVMAFGLVISPVAAIITTIIGLMMLLFLGIFTPITSTFVIIACVVGIAIGIKVRS